MNRPGSCWAVCALALAAAACSGTPAGPVADLTPGADRGVDQGLPDSAGAGDARSDLAPPPVQPPAGCMGYGKLASDITVTLTHGGRKREAYAHLPKGYDGTAMVGVVLNFHGYGSNAKQQALYTDMDRAAYYMKMVAVHPQGAPGPLGTRGWNADRCCGSAVTLKVDDVGYVAALLTELAKKICIDPKKIYATGISNGAFFAYRLACELSDRIAAVAPVAGVMYGKKCKPTRPVPVLHFHGDRDLYVSYAGNKLLDWPGAQATALQMVKHNVCDPTPKQVLKQGEVTCEAWQGCKDKAEVRLCTVTKGGHTWPGALDIPVPWLGHKTKDISATDAMLDFFTAHPMP